MCVCVCVSVCVTPCSSNCHICLVQVVVAALYYNPPVLLELLQKPLPNSDGTILAHFIKQLLNDADCFLGSESTTAAYLGCIPKIAQMTRFCLMFMIAPRVQDTRT